MDRDGIPHGGKVWCSRPRPRWTWGLIPAETDADQLVVVVVSHDCDIANNADREPFVEVIQVAGLPHLVPTPMPRRPGACRLRFNQTRDRRGGVGGFRQGDLSKEAVLQTLPRADWHLTPEDLVTLQKWLAARYHRAAFADEFERRLREKPRGLTRRLPRPWRDRRTRAGSDVRCRRGRRETTQRPARCLRAEHHSAL